MIEIGFLYEVLSDFCKIQPASVLRVQMLSLCSNTFIVKYFNYDVNFYLCIMQYRINFIFGGVVLIHKNFDKTIKKILIDKNMSLTQFAENIGASKQNLSQKLKRGSIRLKDAEELLDILGFELIIKKAD